MIKDTQNKVKPKSMRIYPQEEALLARLMQESTPFYEGRDGRIHAFGVALKIVDHFCKVRGKNMAQLYCEIDSF